MDPLASDAAHFDNLRSISTKRLEEVMSVAFPVLNEQTTSPIAAELEKQMYLSTIHRGESVTAYGSKIRALMLALAEGIQAELLKQASWIPPPHNSCSVVTPGCVVIKNISGLNAVLRVFNTLHVFSRIFGASYMEMYAHRLEHRLKYEVNALDVNLAALGLTVSNNRQAAQMTKSRVPHARTSRLRSGVLAQLSREAETGVQSDSTDAVRGGNPPGHRQRQQTLIQTMQIAQRACDSKFNQLSSLANAIFDRYSTRLFDLVNLIRPDDFKELSGVLNSPERLMNLLVNENALRVYVNYNRSHDVDGARAVLDTLHREFPKLYVWRPLNAPRLPDDVTVSKDDLIGLLRGAMDGTLDDKYITDYCDKHVVVPVATDDEDTGYALGEFHDWLMDEFCDKRVSYGKAAAKFKLLSTVRSFIVPRWRMEQSPKDVILDILSRASRAASEKVLGDTMAS